jgi:D-alanyl-D-alanine carboxypeptidase/D-alanyl-D-alanine-endopeptidase (penicillin-binding protein 4)
MLLKTLAKETQGEGSFDKGTDYLLKYLKSNSITSDNIRIVDGSGLSRFNLFTPRNFVTLLSNIYRSNYREQFVKTLAEPGEEGTLLRRMKRSRAENNVRAKTGSMNNISAICGYVTTRDKEVLAFSIMMQNFTAPMTTAQNLQDLILMRLSSFSRK